MMMMNDDDDDDDDDDDNDDDDDDDDDVFFFDSSFFFELCVEEVSATSLCIRDVSQEMLKNVDERRARSSLSFHRFLRCM